MLSEKCRGKFAATQTNAPHQPQIVVQNPLLFATIKPVQDETGYGLLVPCSLKCSDRVRCHVVKHARFSGQAQFSYGKRGRSALATVAAAAVIRVFLRKRLRARSATARDELQRYNHWSNAARCNRPLGSLKKTCVQAVQSRQLGITPSQSNHYLMSWTVFTDDIGVVNAGRYQVQLQRMLVARYS
jgi:hypothetical protein